MKLRKFIALWVVFASVACLGQGKSRQMDRPFTSLVYARRSLDLTWAHLFVDAINSGDSPAQIARAFSKHPNRRALSQMTAAPGQVYATRMGTLDVIRFGKHYHTLNVVNSFPNLVLRWDQRLFVFHMLDRVLLKRELSRWQHVIDSRPEYSSRFLQTGDSLIADLFSDDMNLAHADVNSILLGAATVSLLSSASEYYISSENAHRGEGGFSETNVNVNVTTDPNLTAAIQRIKTSIAQMADIQKNLGNVQLLSQEVQLANQLKKNNPDLAKEISGQVVNATKRRYGHIYSKFLENLRSEMDAQQVNIGICTERTTNGGVFSSLEDRHAILPFMLARKGDGKSVDSETLKIGQLKVVETLRPKDPTLNLNAGNQSLVGIEVCRGDVCHRQRGDNSNLEQNVADNVVTEIWTHKLKHIATKKLDPVAKHLSQYEAQVQLQNKKYCDAYKRDLRAEPLATAIAANKKNDGCDHPNFEVLASIATDYSAPVSWFGSWIWSRKKRKRFLWTAKHSGNYIYENYCGKHWAAILDSVYEEGKLKAAVAQLKSAHKDMSACQGSKQGEKALTDLKTNFSKFISAVNNYNKAVATGNASVTADAANRLAEAFNSSTDTASQMAKGRYKVCDIPPGEYQMCMNRIGMSYTDVKLCQRMAEDCDESGVPAKLTRVAKDFHSYLATLQPSLNKVLSSTVNTAELISIGESQSLCCGSNRGYCRKKLKEVANSESEIKKAESVQ